MSEPESTLNIRWVDDSLMNGTEKFDQRSREDMALLNEQGR